MVVNTKPIEQMKVTELRGELEARGLESAGLKPALVARLQEAQEGAEVEKDEKVPTSDEDQPPAEAEVEEEEKESPPTANASSNEDEVEKDEKVPTPNSEAEGDAEAEAEAEAEADEDGEETIPYMEPKPDGKAWRFVTNPDKKASPQVSAALTALVDKYGSLKAAVAAGWQFVEKDGTAVSVTKTSGPHHMVPPGGGPDEILTSGKALSAIASAPMPTNAAKRARSK